MQQVDALLQSILGNSESNRIARLVIQDDKSCRTLKCGNYLLCNSFLILDLAHKGQNGLSASNSYFQARAWS